MEERFLSDSLRKNSKFVQAAEKAPDARRREARQESPRSTRNDGLTPRPGPLPQRGRGGIITLFFAMAVRSASPKEPDSLADFMAWRLRG